MDLEVLIGREAEIDDMFKSIMPSKVESVTDNEMAECEALFGLEGKFPLITISTGERIGLT